MYCDLLRVYLGLENFRVLHWSGTAEIKPEILLK